MQKQSPCYCLRCSGTFSLCQTFLLGRTDGLRILLTLAVDTSAPFLPQSLTHTDGQTLALARSHTAHRTGCSWGLTVLPKCDGTPFLGCVPSSANSPHIPPQPGPQSLLHTRAHTHTHQRTILFYFPEPCGCMWVSLTAVYQEKHPLCTWSVS